MTSTVERYFMKTWDNLWDGLCSIENLFLAYRTARKRKTLKPYVIEFERNLSNNILMLHLELVIKSYHPKSLINFTVRDPKTRKISKSDFRDRIVHHALCNVIEPIFEKVFIHDSYANRIGKGTLKAIMRFDYFKRKASRNNTTDCYVLKADIRKYFENVDHDILISLLEKCIADKNIIWLVKKILNNHHSVGGGHHGCGMPLGNLTSQFFANVYLNELDHYVKEVLQVKYYVRYVDDFVILSDSREELQSYRDLTGLFLKDILNIELHPEKTKIEKLDCGTGFLGFRIFYNHKIIKKSNLRKFKNKIRKLCMQYDNKEIDYDKLYDSIEGWIAYSNKANNHHMQNKILGSLEQKFGGEVSTKEYDRHRKSAKIYHDLFFS